MPIIAIAAVLLLLGAAAQTGVGRSAPSTGDWRTGTPLEQQSRDGVRSLVTRDPWGTAIPLQR